MHTAIKRTLRSVGLLEWARRARDRVGEAATPLRYRTRALRCRLAGVANGLPIPPPQLTYLVSGHYDVYASLRNGIRAARSLESILQRNGLDLTTFDLVLDFGCGSGRVLRNLCHLRRGVLHGADYNALLLDWCRASIPFAEYTKNQLEPPIAYADGKFSLVYMFSIFTHWSEELQNAWLAELHRVIRPGGFLIFSTHGSRFRTLLSGDEQAMFDDGNVVVRRAEAEGQNVCAVYHPEPYVRTAVAPWFTVVDFIAEGAQGNGGQDLWLLGKSNRD